MGNSMKFKKEDTIYREMKNNVKREEQKNKYQHDKYLTDVNLMRELHLKKVVWNAYVGDLYIAILMDDGGMFVGKPKFCYNENYSKLEKLKSMTLFEIKLMNDIPISHHIGGMLVSIFTNKINNIIVINETEMKNSQQYHNCAPDFVKRLFPGNFNLFKETL
jgi:hypothetical protein